MLDSLPFSILILLLALTFGFPNPFTFSLGVHGDKTRECSPLVGGCLCLPIPVFSSSPIQARYISQMCAISPDKWQRSDFTAHW